LRPGKSHVVSGLAAAAIFLCLLSGVLPAFEAGGLLQALTGFVLSASAAAAAAAAAWNLHKFDAAVANPEFRMLEGVAFVLRDALSTLRGFAELLLQGKGKLPDGTEPGEACRFILHASEDLAGFAANLQDFARYEQGRIILREEQVDAADLVHAALAPFERMAELADVVIIAPLDTGVELLCDPHRIRRAVVNLVSWSVRSAPAGSNIWVRAERDAEGALALTVTSAAPFPGLDATAGLFEPQLEIQGLNGLALPIARRMALLHSGEVTIAGDADRGTMLRLTLPVGRVTWPNVGKTQAPRAA
jgi:signal transduction histidine kinase